AAHTAQPHRPQQVIHRRKPMIDRPFGRTTRGDDPVNGYTSGPIPKHDVTRDIEDLVHGMTSPPRHESHNRRKSLILSSASYRLGPRLLGHGAARLRRRRPERTQALWGPSGGMARLTLRSASDSLPVHGDYVLPGPFSRTAGRPEPGSVGPWTC